MRMAAGMGAHNASTRQQANASRAMTDSAGNKPDTLQRRLSTVGLSSLGQQRFWNFVSKHPSFTFTALLVIVLNAVWIALDTQWNHMELRDEAGKLPWHPWNEVVENCFAVFFTLEIVVRFLGLESKLLFYKDGPFMFDALIVLCMIVEIWLVPHVLPLLQIGGGSSQDSNVLGDLTVLRLARLVRLTRITRIMRALPELMTLIRGMLAATKAVGSILIFLVLVMYAFSIAFTGQLADYNHKLGPPNYEGDEEWCFDANSYTMFGSIGNSMMTLFTNGVLLDNMTDVLMVLRETNLWLHWLFLLFMVISALTLLNMLIGVLCEVINKAAKQEQEETQLSIMRANLEAAFTRIDTSQDGLVSEKEWDLMRGDPDVRKSLINLGVAELHLDERLEQMQETLFGNITDDLSAEDCEQEPDFNSEGQPRWKSVMSRKYKSRIWCDVGERAQQSANSSGRCLTFNQFVDGILNLRPDVPASALDIEVLKERVRLEEEDINHQIRKLERRLGVETTAEPTLAGATEQEVSERNKPCSAQGTNAVSDAGSSLFRGPGLIQELRDTKEENRRLRMEATGGQGLAVTPPSAPISYQHIGFNSHASHPEHLLQQVPTQLLHYYCKTRDMCEDPPGESM